MTLFLLGVSSARAKLYEGPRAAKHRLDEPGRIIPQHGCVPALPASVSPGGGNFSRQTKSLGAAQNQASVIVHRGLEVKQRFFASGLGRNIFLTFPFKDQDLSTVISDGDGTELHVARSNAPNIACMNMTSGMSDDAIMISPPRTHS